jgi:hypothetical protein
MVIDRYTKVVLTVIAGCLLFQCLMMAGKVVQAQEAMDSWTLVPGRAQPVVIVNKTPVLVDTNRSLPVTVTQSPLAVAVTGVHHVGQQQWDPIDVHVQPQPGGTAPGYARP